MCPLALSRDVRRAKDIRELHFSSSRFPRASVFPAPVSLAHAVTAARLQRRLRLDGIRIQRLLCSLTRPTYAFRL
jgi:hypothetical protein